jgi:hypothetical protein
LDAPPVRQDNSAAVHVAEYAVAAPIPDVDLKQQRKVVDAFFAAVRGGDFEALINVLDPEVVVRSDYGAVRETRRARVAAEGALMFSHLARWSSQYSSMVLQGLYRACPMAEFLRLCALP